MTSFSEWFTRHYKFVTAVDAHGGIVFLPHKFGATYGTENTCFDAENRLQGAQEKFVYK